MKKIFLTGGAGFVGVHIASALLEKGYGVTIFDNFDPYSTNPKTIELLGGKAEIVHGDIRDPDALKNSLAGSFDAVIHCAAIAAVDRSIRDPGLTIYTNAIGTQNVLEAAKENNIKRLHYVSTDEVFGHIESGSFDEMSSTSPRNPYAAGKASGESIALAWSATYDMKITITNTANNYGPYQSLDKLIPRLTTLAIKGDKLPVYGTGKQQREWVHVKDHASAVVTVLEKGESGNRYLVGTREIHENIYIVEQICETLGVAFGEVVKYVKDRPGHDLRYSLDSSKIRDLGWEPKYAFGESLQTVVLWYKDNQEWCDFMKA